MYVYKYISSVICYGDEFYTSVRPTHSLTPCLLILSIIIKKNYKK